MSETKDTIATLSADARHALREFQQQILRDANSAQSCNRPRVELALQSLYQAAEYVTPSFVWCDGPSELATMPLALESLLVPERRPAIDSLLGGKQLDSLLVNLCSQYNSTAFDAYETLLRPIDDRRLRQLDLKRKFNRLLRQYTLKRLQWRYRHRLGPRAQLEIANQLQGPLLRSLLLRTPSLHTAIAHQLQQSVNHPDRFPISPQVDWHRPERDDIESYLGLLGSAGDLRSNGNIPFAVSALTNELRSNLIPEYRHYGAESTRRDPHVASALKSLWHFYHSIHFGFSSIPWLAHHEFARRHLDGELYADCDTEILDAWWLIARESWAFSCHEFVCFITDRPLELHFDQNSRLHHDSHPAIVHADGSKIYAWHGTIVPSKTIEYPPAIALADIDEERNSEVRRIMLERYGIAKYLQDSNAEKIHEDDFGTLYRKKSTRRLLGKWGNGPLEEPLVMVKVVNSTPEPDGTLKDYFLRVPPNITTAREAVAWTFGLTADEYSPSIQS